MSVNRSDEQPAPHEEDNFISRWSRRKQEAGRDSALSEEKTPIADVIAEEPLLTDADMPAIESLTEDSDYSGFLSPKVSEALRKQALRKLFHSPGFNVRDGLDDYDGVYTEFEKLGDIVTADMRHQLEMEAQRRARQLAEDESVENNEEIEVAAVTPASDVTTETEEVPGDIEIEQSIDDIGDAEVES
jgi:hypothetical protein